MNSCVKPIQVTTQRRRSPGFVQACVGAAEDTQWEYCKATFQSRDEIKGHQQKLLDDISDDVEGKC